MDFLPEEVQMAVANDDGDSLRELLQGKPELCQSALRMAAILGSRASACSAAAAGADVNAVDQGTWTVLHHAAHGGHLEVLEVILDCLGDGSTVDLRTSDVRISRLNHVCGGLTPLHLASAAGEVLVVRALLQAKADPSTCDHNGWTAADHAQSKPAVLELLGVRAKSMLPKAEYDQVTRNRNESRAAALTPAAFMRLLDEADAGKLYPLQEVLHSSDVKNLRIESSTALQAACAVGSPQGIRVIVQFLKRQGKPGHDPEAAARLPLPTLNDLDSKGFAPLHTVAETGWPECVAPLLEAGADVHLQTADAHFKMDQTTTIHLEGGQSALHIAVDKGNAALVRALLAGGANVTGENSFKLSARDLALEQVTLKGATQGIHNRIAIALDLGVDQQDVLAAQNADRAAVELCRRNRLNAVQVRIADAEKQKDAATRASERKEVRERYEPLDKAVAHGLPEDMAVGKDLVSWTTQQTATHFKRELALSGSRATGIEEPFPGVFVFSLLSEKLCAKIWAETENYAALAAEKSLPQPVRHDGCLDLSHIFPELLSMIADAAMPAVQALLPAELHEVALCHAFRTKNFVGRDENFKRHVDKYAVTLNVCLHKTPDVKGSGVFFYESKTAEEPAYRHEHAVGLAVLHSSKEWHQTEPLQQGERGSVIMWFSHR